MSFKQEIHAALLSSISGKIEMLRQNLVDIQASLANETKSSAGDKYETARAMLHAGQDSLNSQLDVLLQQQAIVENLDPLTEYVTVKLGSVVTTPDEIFYICVAAGKIGMQGLGVITISPSAPLAQKMLGSRSGMTVFFNGKTYLIKSVD